MIAEDGEVFDPDDSAEVGLVFFPDLGEYGDLEKGLLNEFLTAFSDF